MLVYQHIIFRHLQYTLVQLQPELKTYPGKFLYHEIQKNYHKPLDLQYT